MFCLDPRGSSPSSSLACCCLFAGLSHERRGQNIAQVYSWGVCVALCSGRRGWVCSCVTKHKAEFMVCGWFLVGLLKGLSRVQARAVGPRNQPGTCWEREFLIHLVRGEEDGDALHAVKFAGTQMTLVGSLCCCCSLWKRKNTAAFHRVLLLPEILQMNLA